MSDSPRYAPDRKLDPDYFAGLNENLLRQIPLEARRILDVGCANGRLGHKLKSLRKDRVVFGIERNSSAAELARQVLDAVYDIDVTREIPPIERGTIDCIIFGDVLEHIYDPVSVLRSLKILLSPSGRFVCSIPNVQHFSSLASIISGNFQYQRNGLLDRDHIRFFGAADIQKMFLDAGCLLTFYDPILWPVHPQLIESALPILKHLNLNPDFFSRKTSIYQYICSAEPIYDPIKQSKAITFISAVNNQRPLDDNLLASPLFTESVHEFIPVTGAASAAEALRVGLSRSKRQSEYIVLCHQDVYFPQDWDKRICAQLDLANAEFGSVGVAGVFGVTRRASGEFERAGIVIDRMNLLRSSHSLPVMASSLDELALIFPRQSSYETILSDALGFHFYGSEICLRAKAANRAAVVINAPCLHNTETGYSLSESFMMSARVFLSTKGLGLPYATSCIKFAESGEMSIW